MGQYIYKSDDPEFKAVLQILPHEVYQIADGAEARQVSGSEALENAALLREITNISERQGVWCYTVDKPAADVHIDLEGGKIINKSEAAVPICIKPESRDKGVIIFFNYCIPYVCKGMPLSYDMQEDAMLCWSFGDDIMYESLVPENEKFGGIWIKDLSLELNVVTGTFIYRSDPSPNYSKQYKLESKLDLETGEITLADDNKIFSGKLTKAV